jgi:adenylate cyclase
MSATAPASDSRRPDPARPHRDHEAAIWLSDLRGFTALSDRLPPRPWSTSSTIFRLPGRRDPGHGGEVLKFMGDGLLAVFPIDEYVGDDQQVCSACWRAAQQSRASVAACNTRSGTPSNVSASASHCMSGGFSTAISAAATGSTSPASACGQSGGAAGKDRQARLKRTIVASEGFAGICRAAGAILGNFRLPVFRRRERVFGLVDETSAA